VSSLFLAHFLLECYFFKDCCVLVIGVDSLFYVKEFYSNFVLDRNMAYLIIALLKILE